MTKRRRRLYERNFGAKADWIRGMRCAVCGRPGPSDPAHVVARGMGGAHGGKEDLVPLCREDHREYDARRVDEAQRRRLAALAVELEERWRSKQGEVPGVSA